MTARGLTRDEKKKIRRLVTGMCANYDGESGLCLPLDGSCYKSCGYYLRQRTGRRYA